MKKIDLIEDQNIDYSDINELNDDFFKNAIAVELPRPKESITLRIDHNVLAWFKKKGKGYQTRINAVLKAYMKAHQTQKR